MFLQKQNLATAIYLFGLGTLLSFIIPAGSYQLKIGTGGGSNSTGHNSEGFGATVYGGATTIYTPWPTGNAGSAGGSGSGSSIDMYNNDVGKRFMK